MNCREADVTKKEELPQKGTKLREDVWRNFL
jgi:hypothetical protein